MISGEVWILAGTSHRKDAKGAKNFTTKIFTAETQRTQSNNKPENMNNVKNA
jgi:hypothetical protein